MDGFRLPPTTMREVASQFTTSSQEMMDTSSAIEKAANTLMEGWQGAGAEQFQSDIAEYTNACAKMVELLEERSAALTSSAQAAEELSSALVKQWS